VYLAIMTVMPDKMTSIDQELLGLLRANGRASVAELAHRLGVSRGTVTNRITRMEDAGIIVGYTVRLRPDVRPNEIGAWMSIAVEGNETRKVIASLLGEPGVAVLHDTNGRWDLLAELRAASLAELSQVLERIRLIKGISNTETSIHLKTYRL
jgi:DNA-binding Lrp family transcriptional regulator